MIKLITDKFGVSEYLSLHKGVLNESLYGFHLGWSVELRPAEYSRIAHKPAVFLIGKEDKRPYKRIRELRDKLLDGYTVKSFLVRKSYSIEDNTKLVLCFNYGGKK